MTNYSCFKDRRVAELLMLEQVLLKNKLLNLYIKKQIIKKQLEQVLLKKM